jgi:hypothetical protein
MWRAMLLNLRSFRLLSSLPSARTKPAQAMFCSAPATPKAVNDPETLLTSCCGNGCRDCVLIDIGVASCDDYFAKLEAEIAASSSSRDKSESKT